mgnify:CR=1 FL=1
MSRPVTLQSLIQQAEKIRADLADDLAAIEWWNENRTDAPPFDTGFARVGIRLADAQIAAFKRGDTRGPETDKLMEHLKTGAQS